MASTLFSSISKLLVVFALLHLVHVHEEQPSWFVKGDFIVDECNKTPYPSVCLDCLNTDHSRKSDSREELVSAVLLCALSQAVNAHNEAASLLKNTTGPADLKAAFEFCEKSLTYAENNLVEAQEQIGAHLYNYARFILDGSRQNVYDCEKHLLPVLRTIIDSKKLLDGMQATIHLDDVAELILRPLTDIQS